MKKVIVIWAVWVVVVVMAGLVSGGYNHADPPPGAQDCIDALMPIPPSTLRQFGASDKTRLVYNIAEILKACKTYTAQIAALEKQVAALQQDLEAAKALTNGLAVRVAKVEARPVYDPNDLVVLEEKVAGIPVFEIHPNPLDLTLLNTVDNNKTLKPDDPKEVAE